MANRKEYPNCAIKSPERAKEEALMIAALKNKKDKEKKKNEKEQKKE